MKEKREILVSIAVITYNSSKTVIETLDSAFNQTYPNIELIVSDDGSHDNTVDLCKEWVELHKNRFVRTHIIASPTNTGTSANMNRVDNACQGEWIKPIAGDDILLPECVQEYIEYVKKHPECVYAFCKVDIFGGDTFRRQKAIDYGKYEFFEWDLEKQYDYLTLEGPCVYAAGSFYNKQEMVNRGMKYDERIPIIEDWPRCINIVKNGIKMHLVDKILVRYRISDSSISTHAELPISFQKSDILVYKYYCFKNNYLKRDKRQAVYKYLRGELFLHDNALFWKIICKLYKILILHKW